MQILQLASKLQSVGLSDKQARVYVTALFLGPSAVQKIAAEADINRAITYVILYELQNLGLVTESIRGKKTVFVAEPAESIEKHIEAQEKSLQAKRAELNALMPKLREVTRSSTGDDVPSVRFYSGKLESEEIQKAFIRKAKPGSTIYQITNIDETLKRSPDYLEKDLSSSQSKNLTTKLLYSYSGGDIVSTSKYLRKTKKINEAVNTDITIYEDGVVVSNYDNENSGVLIESTKLASSMKQLFELAWNGNVST